MKSERKRIAVIIPGGIGVGHNNQGIPVLESFLQNLGRHYQITVFPLGIVHADYQPTNFELVPIQLDYNRPLWRRILLTTYKLILVHSKQPFDFFYGIWTFPSGFLAVVMAKLFSVKSLVSLQGGGLAKIPSIQYGGRMGKWSNKMIHWTLKNANYLSAETNFQRQLVPIASLREQVQVIPYGVETRLFPYQPVALEAPIQLLHIANLNPVKDQMTLLRCFELLDKDIDVELTIIGPDYLDGRLQAYVQKAGLQDKVKFLGFIPHQEITSFMAKAHFLVISSLHEGMPLVAVEAMASGLVVCGTRVGILADLAPECCLAVDIGNPQALAEAILSLIQDSKKLATIRRQAYLWASQHNIHWTTQQFIQLIDSPENRPEYAVL